MKQIHKPRAARRDEIILTAFGQMTKAQKPAKAFTNAKMAKWLGLSASSKLKSIIDELADDGWLTKEEKIHRSSWHKDGYLLEIKKHVYSLSPMALAELAII